jgi:glutamate synthase domain-containing protein 3
LAFEPARKMRKEEASCAIFGAISFSGRPLKGRLAVDAICEAESARGGTYGNGVMLAHAERGQRGKKICIWAGRDVIADRLCRMLSEDGVELGPIEKSGGIYMSSTEAEYLPLLTAVVRANSVVPLDEGRVISFGHGMKLYKGLESLSELDSVHGLGGMDATAMIAHTRYPTGSQPKVARAHPFSFGNVGIVHNGDVTSYMANLAACEARLAEIYHLYSRNGVGPFLDRLRKSWAGTDSEVIAAMMYTMLKTGLMSEPGLSIGGIMAALVPPFDNHLTWLQRGSDERVRLNNLARQYRGFGLDGPVSSIVLTTYEDEVQLIAFRDRNTFRPLQIVIDHEEGRVLVASELRQIIAATGLDPFSSKVESFSPEPGKFLWVSSKSGIVTSGRSRRPCISVPPSALGADCMEISGSPHQFAGERISGHVTAKGTLGSHGGSYSEGDGTLEIIGSLQDNCFEASSVREVVCHANASMMAGNAFQGERFFLRGSADSRAFQQLRPRNGMQPVAIIGETAGQYLGKMMSGGAILVLGLEHLGREDVDTPIVGEFVGTGMVGGRIYVRGYVMDDFIKRPPQRRDVIAVCAQLKEEGLISESALREIRHNPLSLPRVERILESTEKPEAVAAAVERLSPLFDRTLRMERRALSEGEKAELSPHLHDYFRAFGLEEGGLGRVLSSNFTIIGVRDASP